MEITQERHLTIVELAQVLHLAVCTTRQAVIRGEFPGAFKYNARGDWRIPETAVMAWIEAKQRGTKPTRFSPFQGPPPPAASQSPVPESAGAAPLEC